MALLQDLEPPSSPSNEVKSQESQSNPDPRNKVFRGILSSKTVSTLKRLYSFCLEIPKAIAGAVSKAAQSVVDFIVSGKFLPHFAISFLLIIVLFANFSEVQQAKAFMDQLVSVDPSTELSVVTAVDTYTPIGNDTALIQRTYTAPLSSDGFAAVSAPVDTQITARTAPLPDNSKNSINYTVLPGDTLSGLGWQFGVKLATLKYVNNITNADQIKPGVNLKIPPRGYEVSASQIAAKANTTVAAANRSAITSKNSTQKSNGSAGGYVGVINGVTYVSRSYGQCYTYVTSQGYAVGGHLLAKWIPTNSSTPKVGGLVVTYESWAGHVAIVIGVNGDGTFNIRERNYSPGWITERTMNVNSSYIKGFVN